ncbi:unnamed protein product, partial [Brenthis ino]
MPDPRVKPVSASDSATSDEASKLELYLQRQLEEDVASDAYTECDITAQEKEILIFLKRKLFTNSSNNLPESKKIKDEIEDIDVFLTPNCPSPYKEKICQELSCLSPSTELTKEYYALVHIEGNLLEQELIEQDALSDAFHTIIKSQDRSTTKNSQRIKPSSLSLISSHSPKTIKHSNNCDIYSKLPLEQNSLRNGKEIEKENYNVCMKPFDQYSKIVDFGKVNGNESLAEKLLDPAYSPDSLITDDPSSSSDYLSAAYACSPALGSSGCLPQLNAGENSTKMENIFTSSDSGLDNTGMLESLNSHKDVMLTDLSLTESTLHDLTIEDTNHSQESTSSPEADLNQIQKIKLPLHRTGTSSLNSAYQDSSSNGIKGTSNSKSNDIVYGKSSKEEKQRQNEEIVILESSSVSSETGSWESVFPPKITDKEICDKFIHNERQFVNEDVIIKKGDTHNMSECQSYEKSSTKTTPCFIDAASLADEDQVSVNLQEQTDQENVKHESDYIPVPSQPVPCSRPDISPGDWSESNDNEDSLEQPDNKEPDSIQKDLSPTIFEMTPITEDSLSTNDMHENKDIFETKYPSTCQPEKSASLSTNTVYMGTTPHNSIMSLKTSSLKQYESEESESDTIVISRESLTNFRSSRFNESSPIVSGGASIEDVRSPKIGTQNNSPSVRRKVENIPIVTGACLNQESTSLPKSPKSVSGSAWVVDMSSTPKVIEVSKSAFSQNLNKKPGDRVCETLKNETKHTNTETCSKSRSSVESDSSEKSGHKFYIDLSTLPDPLPPEKPNNDESTTEKKNIFSMYIDLGEKSTLKEMPTRLSSSLNVKKQSNDSKILIKNSKNTKVVSNEKVTSLNSSSSYFQDQSTVSTTFERYESLCNDPNITISEIIAIPEPALKTTKPPSEVENIKNEKQHLRRNGDKSFISNTSFTIHEESTNEQSDLFVKLSDLDKPIQTSDIFERDSFDVRMTRSIPENNWSQQNIASTSRSSEVISSFHSENALSLNRLFPHLKNEFSKSMPISLSGRTRSPLRQGGSSSVGEIDEQVSDVSEISSVQSSMCRSVIENSTTEETSQTSSSIGNCQSRLGQDLLRMFLEEIAPDVIVEVSGKRIKAHKCILSSRCQYFAGILSGGWVESAGNVIVLPPFSFNVVHFALCHIYSGLSTIPDSVSIVELATIADMLGLEGLKEAIMFTLKAKYCHHFHRPCQVCTAGVLECFPLSSVYGLDDLYRKCLRWITKYFTKVWPTKTFATLPKELLDKCYQEHIVNLSTDNLIETVYGCGITVASLQNSRWAEIVARMCRKLVNAAAHFAAPRLLAVLEMISLVPDAPNSAKQALDDCLAAAIEWAPPDETCRAYAFLSTLIRDIRNQHSKPDLINNQTNKVPEPNNLLYTHAGSWRLQCEGALVRAAPRVVGTQAFKDLPTDLRRRLRELGCIMYGPQAIPLTASPLQDRKTKSTYQSKPKTINPATTRSLDMEKVRNSFVPYKPKPIVIAPPKDKVPSTCELRDKRVNNKISIPKVRTTKAQEERAKFNQTKTLTSQDRSVSNKPVAVRPHPFENTKPSESSRNSSPIQSRNLRTGRLAANQVCEKKSHAMSQDSLATSSRPRTAEPSTDSLSESQNSNKYATYTKTKHTGKGSVESVVSKCQLLSPSSLLNANVKTKIPVYFNQNSVSCNGSGKSNTSTKGQVCTHSAKIKSRVFERKVSGSLMSATKSSSAKIVPKVAKEHPPKLCKQHKHATKINTSSNINRREEHEPIPAMERSGTFLKDEPMFATKSTNIDKAQ